MSVEGRGLALVRAALRDIPSLQEVRMFGGTAFMINGHMTLAISPRGLLVRVAPEEHDQALKISGTRAMQMRDRTMLGYIYVEPVPTDAQVMDSWVQRALRYNWSLPPRRPLLKAVPLRRRSRKQSKGDPVHD